jgi:hypothetical protein
MWTERESSLADPSGGPAATENHLIKDRAKVRISIFKKLNVKFSYIIGFSGRPRYH